MTTTTTTPADAADPRTAEGGAQFRDLALAGARVNLETDGTLAPMCLMLARRDPDTLTPFAHPRLLVVGGMPMGDDESRDLFAATIAEAAVRSNALAATFVTEVWVVGGDRATFEATSKWKAEHGSLENFPGRREEVRVTWEHVEMGVEIWSAPIMRDGDRVTCGEFTCDATQGAWFGRFTQLLPPSAYGIGGAEA